MATTANWLNFDLPVREQVRNGAEIIDYLQGYKLIPVYGRDFGYSLNLIKTINSLAATSPSLRACISDLQNYSFGSKIDVQNTPIEGLIADKDEKELPYKDKIDFIQLLKSTGINISEVIRVSGELLDSGIRQGNEYLRIQLITALGKVKGVKFTVIDQANVMYINGNSAVMISDYFDQSYWLTVKKPEILPVSELGKPAVWKDVGGDYVTVLHIRNNATGENFYGKPIIFPVLDSLLAEYRTLVLNSKIASTEMVAKMIMFFEELPPERQRNMTVEEKVKEFRLRMGELRKQGSNESVDPKSLIGLEYPNDTNQPLAVPLQVNRDVDYAEFTLNNASSVVYAVCGWAKELTGQVQVRTGIGANLLYDLFTIKNVATITPLQQKYESVWDWIIGQIFEVKGEEIPKLSLKFEDKIRTLVEKLSVVDSTLANAKSPQKVNNNSGLNQ